MDKAMQNGEFDEWLHFEDRPADDLEPGPARAVEIGGRCASCWGPVVGTNDSDGRWNRLQCRLCGQSIDREDAQREVDSMRREAADNIAATRVGHPANYREGALFVLKILPNMDRDTQQVDRRMEASRAAKRKHRRLTRTEIPPGTAGYLYAQARAFLCGLENLSHEMSAITLSDFDFSEPQIVDIDARSAHATVPTTHRRPSDRELMARMGTAVLAGMAAAFACEVGMKAILMTRLDEAEKTHDLLKLYRVLPDDSRERLEADFAGIAEVLEHNRHTFGKWRYFEQSVGKDAIGALVNTDRVRDLGKAARVIVDECVVTGLTYEVHVDTTFELEREGGEFNSSQRINLRVEGGEIAAYTLSITHLPDIAGRGRRSWPMSRRALLLQPWRARCTASKSPREIARKSLRPPLLWRSGREVAPQAVGGVRAE